MSQQERGVSEDLKIPANFSKYDEIKETETIVRLEEWKRKAYKVLNKLQEDLRARGNVDADVQAEITYHLSPFVGDGPWVLESSREVAVDILSTCVTPTTDLQERVLRGYVKPIFQPNPHPLVNVDTGRKLPRPAGGPLGHLDYMEGQEWKNHPGIFYVLSWCMSHTDTPSVERLWHLFVPPIMTFLDDYEAKYKLRGVHLVSQLLEITPSDLLRRTGIDSLIMNSLKTCLTFLKHQETPDLIRAAVPTSVRLIEMTTSEGSETRFNQLCALLGDGIIGSIWLYASRDPDTLQASVEALPTLVHSLGVGTSRYLKGLVPQLVFPLIPGPDNGANMEYKIASLQALIAVMQSSAPRIYVWRGTILEAIAKCWVNMARDAFPKETEQLSHCCRTACALLWTLCEPVREAVRRDYERIMLLDPDLFQPLLQPAMDESCNADRIAQPDGHVD